jgi:hypothetical protein
LPAPGNRSTKIAKSQSKNDLKAPTIPLEYTLKLPR